MTLSAENLTALLNETQPHTKQYFLTSLTFDNGQIQETFPLAGVRLSGDLSRTLWKKSFKVKISKFTTSRVVVERHLNGLSGFHLRAEALDPSLIRERLTYDAFQSFGLCPSRASYALVNINQQFFGVYLLLELVDGKYLSQRFGPVVGNLYKCDDPLDYSGESQFSYVNCDQKTNKDVEIATNFQPIISLLSFLHNTPNGTFFRSLLPGQLEVDSFLRYLAVVTVMSSLDNYPFATHNYYFYQNPFSNTARFIWYDEDMTLGYGKCFGPYDTPNLYDTNTLITGRLLDDEGYHEQYTYYMRLVVLLLSISNSSSPLYRRIADLKEQLFPYAVLPYYNSQNSVYNSSDFLSSFSDCIQPDVALPVSGLLPFIENRTSYVQKHLSNSLMAPVITELFVDPWNPTKNNNSVIITALVIPYVANISMSCTAAANGISATLFFRYVTCLLTTPWESKPMNKTGNSIAGIGINTTLDISQSKKFHINSTVPICNDSLTFNPSLPSSLNPLNVCLPCSDANVQFYIVVSDDVNNLNTTSPLGAPTGRLYNVRSVNFKIGL